MRRKYVCYLHLHTIPRYISGSPRRLRGAIRLHGILRKRHAAAILKFYCARPAVSINTEGKNGKRGACASACLQPCIRERNAGDGRVRNVISACAAPGSQVFVFVLYSATVPGRRVYGALCGTAVCAGRHRKP